MTTIVDPLDGDTDVGDVAEIHAINGSGGLHIYTNSGSLIKEIGNDQVVMLRKIAANNWRVIGFYPD
jgi:cellulose synthase/poly-beta-1,6-N-acetylglucosamine synthase-like glycosyltransferase